MAAILYKQQNMLVVKALYIHTYIVYAVYNNKLKDYNLKTFNASESDTVIEQYHSGYKA